MTPDPQHNNPQHRADPIIDRTLNVLRDAQPRAGVDAMNRRLLAALHSRELATPHPAATPATLWQRLRQLHFAGLTLPMSAAVLIAVILLLPRLNSTLPSPNRPAEVDNTYPTSSQPVPPAQQTNSTTQPKNRVPHISLLRCGPATTACTPTYITTPVAQITPNTLTVQTMLDDLYAPSHPTQPMPLSLDERTLLRATRQGSEIQIAFLEAPQRPSTHTPNSAIAQYIHHMLAPLAMAEALDPTPPPEPEAPPAATETLDSSTTFPR